jgi:hypothetical protein
MQTQPPKLVRLYPTDVYYKRNSFVLYGQTSVEASIDED